MVKIKKYKVKDVILTVTSLKAIVRVVTKIGTQQFDFKDEDTARLFIKSIPRSVEETELDTIYYVKINQVPVKVVK